MTVSRDPVGSPQREKACSYQQKRDGSCWTNRTQAPVTTITTTWTFSPSRGLVPVSAHDPPLPKAGAQACPPVPSHTSALCRSGTSETKFTATLCLETRAGDVPTRERAEENPEAAPEHHHPGTPQPSITEATSLGPDVCSEDRDAKSGLVSSGAVTLS